MKKYQKVKEHWLVTNHTDQPKKYVSGLTDKEKRGT